MLEKMIARAIAALVALSLSPIATAEETSEHTMGNIPGMEKCYGVAKLGMNDCGTAHHHCAGESKLDADKNEWVLVPSGLCKKIVGGSTTLAAK